MDAANFSDYLGGFNVNGDIAVGNDVTVLRREMARRTGYRGTPRQLQFAIFYEEGIESMNVSKNWVAANSPQNPQGYPATVVTQAASEMLTDDFLVSVGDPPRMPGLVGFNAYLTWRGPPSSHSTTVTHAARKNGATPTAGYGIKATRGQIDSAFNNGLLLKGWDCSRVGM